MSGILVDELKLTLSYEMYLGEPYLHFEVRDRWTPSLKKECLERLEDVKQLFKEEGYTKLYTGTSVRDKKLQKFVQLFGFELEQEMKYYNVYSQELT